MPKNLCQAYRVNEKQIAGFVPTQTKSTVRGIVSPTQFRISVRFAPRQFSYGSGIPSLEQRKRQKQLKISVS
jgi:hypothetical protein